jgi:type IV secretory pathway VirB10-like protein
VEILKNMIFKEKVPLTNRKDLNTAGIVKVAACLVAVLAIALLFMPTEKHEQADFHERVTATGSVSSEPKDSDPTNQAIEELKASQANLRNMPKPNLYSGGVPNAYSGAGGGSSVGDSRNASMILGRGGSDSKNALTVGTRVNIMLSQGLTIANQTMPVTGIVSADVISDSSLAIPEGSKIIGEASFDESNGRANLSWKTIVTPDGRERQFSAISVGRDNQVGVEGNVKSNTLKNTVGQVLTEFIGAYASGSMTSGMLGSTEGGVQNGLKSAVAKTAQDRANSFGEDMKKEHQWIELQAGTSVVAVLSQSFVFRDPGATYGK